MDCFDAAKNFCEQAGPLGPILLLIGALTWTAASRWLSDRRLRQQSNAHAEERAQLVQVHADERSRLIEAVKALSIRPPAPSGEIAAEVIPASAPLPRETEP